jgi:hypothetical protein
MMGFFYAHYFFNTYEKPKNELKGRMEGHYN